MLLRTGREIPSSEITPQGTYEAFQMNRRSLMAGLGAMGAAAVLPRIARAEAKLNGLVETKYAVPDRATTPEAKAKSYNNFYEWGLSKEEPKDLANRGWKTNPWKVEVSGLCANPGVFTVDELSKLAGGLERRNYRHRCVEAWSMVIPWDGFPLARLVAAAQPKPEAKYVKFVSFLDPASSAAQRSGALPWPYLEGLTLPEATNELAFLAAGLYGKPLRNQNGVLTPSTVQIRSRPSSR